MLDYDEVREALLNDLVLDFERRFEKKNNKKPSEKDQQSIMTLSMVVLECFAPAYFKLRKIQLRYPDFKPRRVYLSPLAWSRFEELLKKELVTNNGQFMGLPYVKSSRVLNENYCRFIGDTGGSST